MSIFRYKNEQGEWFELPFLRGPQGPSGVDGKDGKNGIDGTNGKDGKDGVGIAKTEVDAEGRLVVTYTDGTSETLSKVVGADGKDGANGADGKDGADGYTPIKGTDYFTEVDKQELVQLVLESLPSAEEVAF